MGGFHRSDRQHRLSGRPVRRSLCSDPKLLMLDEPFAGIDPIAVEDIQRVVRELRDRDGLAILITEAPT